MKLSFEDGVELEGFVNAWTPDPSIGDLIRWSIGRIAVKRLRQLQATAPDGQHLTLMHAMPGDGHVQHIVDWLTADFLAGADWIDRVDDRGRPLKLMKCGSVEQLLHEADKAMRRRLQGKVSHLGKEDESLVTELADCYTVVRLLTPAALDLESSRMQHCVGHGSYDRGVADETTEIYSLRDPAGKPHATIEVMVDRRLQLSHLPEFRLSDLPVDMPPTTPVRTIYQIQGKQNLRPLKEYMDLLKPWLKGSLWQGVDYYWPTVTDAAGTAHEIDAIPPGTVFQELTIDGWRGVTAGAVPEDVTVLGNLTVYSFHFVTRSHRIDLPATLTVHGKIISKIPPEMFPEHLREKVEKPLRWKEIENGLLEYRRAVAFGEPWIMTDEIDVEPGMIYTIGPDAHAVLRREAERQGLIADPNLRGSRTLLGEGLPRLPDQADDERPPERHWQVPQRARPRRARAVPPPPTMDFETFSSRFPEPMEPAVKVSILPEQEAPAPQPGFVPPPAGYYPERRRHAVTVQQVSFSDFHDTLMTRIAAGVGLTREEAYADFQPRGMQP